jgi:hypothetical protein
MGLIMKNQQHDYDRLSMSVETEAQADAAVQARSAGETYAVVADLLYALGGAAIVTGGIWLAFELTGEPRYESTSATAFAPILGPHQVGLVWTQRGGAL